MLYCLIFSFSLLISFISAEDYIELNKENFDTKIKEYDVALVKFYAEWCGHCKRMAPEFSKAATVLKNHRYPVQLIKVNCPDNDDLCGKFGVSGYPTLKIYRNGVYSEDYDGGREAADIISSMKSRAGPASTEIKSQEEIKDSLAGDDSFFVAYLKEGSKSLDTYLKAASAIRQPFSYFHQFDSDAVSKHGSEYILRYLPTKTVSKMEENFVTLSLPASTEDIEKFIIESWGGELAWEKSSNPKIAGHGSKVTVYFNLNYELDPKGTNYIRNRLLKAIKELRKDGCKLRFFMASAPTNAQFLSQQFNKDYDKSSKSIIVTAMSATNSKYVMNDEFSYDNFKKFVKDLENDKLEPYLKSEPVPTSQDEAVVKVVAKTFDEIVRDATKDVMIEMYAPWCGHCKNLKPIYEELAKKLEHETSITIAAMDATANDVPPEFSVSGFPTIFWVPKDKKTSPRKYEGERTVAGFIKFIKEHSSTTLSIKDEL